VLTDINPINTIGSQFVHAGVEVEVDATLERNSYLFRLLNITETTNSNLVTQVADDAVKFRLASTCC